MGLMESGTAGGEPSPEARENADLVALIERSEQANRALMQGAIDVYKRLIRLADDFVLMSPFGGTPSRGSEYTPERIEAMGRFFRNGTLSQDLVAGWASPELVVLVTVEHCHVEVGGLPAQSWALRVSQVYRRDGQGWQLIHRHADPLHHGVSLTASAALARGGLPIV
jgi:ketosteroid isomerase-like protein